jgi:hypothetical protein
MKSHSGTTALPPCLYALIDMGRLPEPLRQDVTEKLNAFGNIPLLTDPRYSDLKAYSAFLVHEMDRRADTLLEIWGGYSSDIVSAWIVSRLDENRLAAHLRRANFAVDVNKAHYLLRWYDPLITPVLYRLADTKWVLDFFGPIIGWWYPIATPQEETWKRIEGDDDPMATQMTPLLLTEELWDALESDPLPYRLLSFVEKADTPVFAGDCYGVRLAKIEAMLNEAKQQGLHSQDDLTVYVLSLLETPARSNDPNWQAAIQMAAAGKAALKAYFTP